MEEEKKNKKIWIILIIIILILAAALLILIIRGEEDTWICQRGQWIKHGAPSAPMPDYPCGAEEQMESENIRVFSPKPNEEISSPVQISGEAVGSWYFEADFPIELIDENGKSLAVGFVTAQGEWMTEEFVPFNGALEFDPGEAEQGKLIFRKDNPSDLPELDEEFIVPVHFKKSAAMEDGKTTVKVYFGNDRLDPEITCVKVFPVERKIEKTSAVAKAAIEELLKGPTDSEKADGYGTSINPGVKLNSIRIENSTAYVDFDKQLEYQVGGSCRVGVISHQITETLKQFSTVQNVVISVEGRTEDILQP